MVFQQPLTGGIAMVIERDHAVGHIDMVSGKALARNDPFAIKSFQRGMLEKGAGENGAGAVNRRRYGPATPIASPGFS
jgi:hypothetical protein